MNQQQFETSERQQQALQDRQVTPEELRAVIDLWSQERSQREGVDARSSVSDVAEGLEISAADAARLLEQVRAQRAQEQQRQAEEREAQEAAREQLDASARLAESEARRAEAEARRAEAEAAHRQAQHLRQLQQLHADGVLNDEEFARAKVRALEGDKSTGVVEVGKLQGEMRRLQLQNEIERLDREWLIEREQYASHDKNGGTHYPGDGATATIGPVIGGLLTMGFLSCVLK